MLIGNVPIPLSPNFLVYSIGLDSLITVLSYNLNLVGL